MRASAAPNPWRAFRTIDARTAAYLLVAVVLIVLGADIFRIPFVYIDNFRTLEQAGRLSGFEYVDESSGLTEIYRPLNILLTRAVLLIHGADFHVFRSAQLATLAVLFLGWLKVCDPRTWPDFWRFVIATTCLLGLHTTRFLFHGIPLNTYTIVCATGLWAFVLARGDARRLSWLWPPLLALFALLTMEMGVVVPVIVVTAYFGGWRGATTGGAVGASLVVIGYVVWRATFRSGFGESPFYTETGFGFGVLDVPQQERLFGSWPIVFYGYNAGSSLLTVLASEPRNGVFEFIHSLWMQVIPAPWQWVNVITSTATTAVIAWAVVRAPVHMTTIWVAVAAMLANAALSFLYARDRIPSFAGLMYALCLYVSLVPILDRLRAEVCRFGRHAASNESALLSPGRVPRLIRCIAAVSLCLLAAGWGLRTVGAHVALRDAAWGSRQEWVNLAERRSDSSSPQQVAAAELFLEMKRQALARDIPDPRLDPPWTFRWLERDSSVR